MGSVGGLSSLEDDPNAGRRRFHITALLVSAVVVVIVVLVWSALKLTRGPSFHSCPLGHDLRGAPPPDGFKEWCELDGKKSGPSVQYHRKATQWVDRRAVPHIVQKGQWRDGKKHGKWTRWATTKPYRTVRVESYDDGQLHGEQHILNAKGALLELAGWKHGKRDGQWAAFYPSVSKDAPARPRARGPYADDKKHGRWETYDNRGQTTSVTHWRNGKKHGAYQRAEQSVIVHEASYEDDKLHGRERRRRGDGRVLVEGAWEHGERVGTWKTWTARGHPETEQTWVDGRLHGASRTYYPDGQVKEEGTYEDDKKIDAWTKFHENGERARLTNYEDGVQIGWRTFDESGGQIASAPDESSQKNSSQRASSTEPAEKPKRETKDPRAIRVIVDGLASRVDALMLIGRLKRNSTPGSELRLMSFRGSAATYSVIIQGGAEKIASLLLGESISGGTVQVDSLTRESVKFSVR